MLISLIFQVYQNLLLASAWVLLSGLQTQLAITSTPSTEKDKVTHSRERDDKGRSPSKSRDSNSARISLMKVYVNVKIILLQPCAKGYFPLQTTRFRCTIGSVSNPSTLVNVRFT